MKRSRLSVTCLLLSLILCTGLLMGCGGGGGDGGNGGGGSSSWDEMVWDQDNWG